VRRAAVAIAAALCLFALFAAFPGPAGAQGSAQVYRDQSTGLLVYVADLSGRQPGEVRLGFTSQVFWFFNPFNPIEPGFGCAFVTPFSNFAFCQNQMVNGLLVQLGPGPNDIHVLPTWPILPGPNLIQGNKGKDKIKGGAAAERVNAGKGKDKIDPGGGEDVVLAGPGDDTIRSRDGERDRVDCGPGRDSLEPDNKDSAKNCEEGKGK
jgi:hypothetical protein